MEFNVQLVSSLNRSYISLLAFCHAYTYVHTYTRVSARNSRARSLNNFPPFFSPNTHPYFHRHHQPGKFEATVKERVHVLNRAYRLSLHVYLDVCLCACICSCKCVSFGRARVLKLWMLNTKSISSLHRASTCTWARLHCKIFS